MTILKTPRLILRRARSTDVDDMHRVLSDPAGLAYWSCGPHTGRDETVAWIEAMIAAPDAESDDFVIEHEGVVIGKLGAWRLPEIGYILAPARTDVERLTAGVDPRNLRSLAMLERHGFVRTGYATGTLHTHTGIADSVYLELRRADCAAGN